MRVDGCFGPCTAGSAAHTGRAVHGLIVGDDGGIEGRYRRDQRYRDGRDDRSAGCRRHRDAWTCGQPERHQSTQGHRPARTLRLCEPARRRHLLSGRVLLRLRRHALWVDRAGSVAIGQGHSPDQPRRSSMDRRHHDPAMALRCAQRTCHRRARRAGRRRRRPRVFHAPDRRRDAVGGRIARVDRRSWRLPAHGIRARPLHRLCPVGPVDRADHDTRESPDPGGRRTPVGAVHRRRRRRIVAGGRRGRPPPARAYQLRDAATAIRQRLARLSSDVLPGRGTAAQAAPIDVDYGDDRTGLDVELRPAPRSASPVGSTPGMGRRRRSCCG